MFLKIKKNIILIYFQTKKYLKNQLLKRLQIHNSFHCQKTQNQ